MTFDGVVPFLMDWGTTPHPTTRDLPECTLVDLEISHPAAHSVVNAGRNLTPFRRLKSDPLGF